MIASETRTSPFLNSAADSARKWRTSAGISSRRSSSGRRRSRVNENAYSGIPLVDAPTTGHNASGNQLFEPDCHDAVCQDNVTAKQIAAMNVRDCIRHS